MLQRIFSIHMIFVYVPYWFLASSSSTMFDELEQKIEASLLSKLCMWSDSFPRGIFCVPSSLTPMAIID